MRSIAVGVLVMLAAGATGTVEAQQPVPNARVQTPVGDTLRLTLSDALAQAEPASEQVGIAAAGVRKAKGAVMQTRSYLLPQVNLGPQYTHVFENPYQNFFPPDTTGSNPFTSTNQWRIGGSASMSLLNLSQWAQLGASKTADARRRAAAVAAAGAHDPDGGQRVLRRRPHGAARDHHRVHPGAGRAHAQGRDARARCRHPVGVRAAPRRGWHATTRSRS